MAQTIKHLPAMQRTWVQSLGQNDSLEKGKATHSSILAQRIPQTEVPGRLQSMGSQSGARLSNSHTHTHLHTHTHTHTRRAWGEMNGF